MSPKNQPRKKRSDEELREASNWLIYEIWMFRGLVKEIEYGTLSGLGVVSNAILDSFFDTCKGIT